MNHGGTEDRVAVDRRLELDVGLASHAAHLEGLGVRLPSSSQLTRGVLGREVRLDGVAFGHADIESELQRLRPARGGALPVAGRSESGVSLLRALLVLLLILSRTHVGHRLVGEHRDIVHLAAATTATAAWRCASWRSGARAGTSARTAAATTARAILVLLAFLVTGGKPRKFEVLLQRHRHQHLRVVVDPSGVELAVGRREIACADEHQPLALAVEGRVAVAIETARDLRLRLGGVGFLGVVDEDRLKLGGVARARPGEVARVVREGNANRTRRLWVLVDVDARTILELQQVDVAGLVLQRDRLRIRRPSDRGAESMTVLGDLLGRLDRLALGIDGLSIGGHGVELVLASCIAEVRDGLAIRTPRRRTLERTVGAREVARRSILRRRRPNVAARDDRDSLARRRNRGALNVLRRIDGCDAQRVAVARDSDVNWNAHAGFEVEPHDAVAVLQHHLARAGVIRADRRPLHIVGLELRDLLGLARRRVVAEHIEHIAFGFAAVGEVVDLAAVPHRNRVGSFPIGDALGLAGLQVGDPNIGRHTAAVTLPSAGVGRVRRVGEPFARLIDRTVGAVGNRQFRRQTAADWHGVELLRAGEPLERRGHKDQSGSVGSPVAQAFRRGVMGDALGNAAADRKDVEVEGLVVVGAEGDRLAVGRETGRALESRRTGERTCDAALLGHDPKVVAIGKHDVGLRDIGIAAETSGDIRSGGEREEHGRQRGRARTTKQGDQHGAQW